MADDALLRDAIARWGESRTTADAERVDTAAAAALAGWTPPADSDDRTWRAAADDLAHRTWALATMLREAPTRFTYFADARTGYHRLATRIHHVARHGPDPRIARALLELAAACPNALEIGRVFEIWNAAIATSWDEPSIAAAERLTDAGCSMQILRALARLIPGRATPAPTPEVMRLWSEVGAAPGDDGARTVLADALLAGDDPRGELIALQLAPESGDRDARLARLLELHGRRWLGAIAQIVGRAQFRRGALARIEIGSKWGATDWRWTDVLADPALRTVEDVVYGPRIDAGMIARVVSSAGLVSLRRIDVRSLDVIAALERAGRRVEHVAIDFAALRKQAPAAAIAARLLELGMRSLAIPAAQLEALPVDVLARLDRVTLGGGLGACLERWPMLPRHVELGITRTHELERCVAQPWDAKLELRRGDGGAVTARIGGDWLLTSLDVALARLRPELARVELADAAVDLARRVKLARPRVAIEVMPSQYGTGNVAV